MNDKASVNLIKKKLRKRKNIQKTSKVLFYENELSNLLKSSQLMSKATEKKPAENLPVSNVENEHLELDLKSKNKEIAELEDTRERLVIYKKLIAVRAQHSRQDSDRQSIERLDGLLKQIDGRLVEYRAVKQRICGIFFGRKIEFQYIALLKIKLVLFLFVYRYY